MIQNIIIILLSILCLFLGIKLDALIKDFNGINDKYLSITKDAIEGVELKYEGILKTDEITFDIQQKEIERLHKIMNIYEKMIEDGLGQ